MLTAAELASMRAAVADLLPGTCRIERPTTSVGDDGIVSTTWGTATASAACRIDPDQANDIRRGVAAKSEKMAAYYIGSFGWNEDIRSGDRVVFEGETYEIVTLYDDHSHRVARRASLSKLEGS